MKPDYKARKRGMPTMSIEERLKSNVRVNDISGCWEWTGCKNTGYGHTIVGSRTDGTRPDWCPLRPLPDAHGDLIDRGQLVGRFVPRQAYFTDAIKEKIETAPTIIEAEGGNVEDDQRRSDL